MKVCMDVYRVGSDGSMITGQGCVGIKSICVACAAIMTRWQIGLDPASRGEESRLAEGLARDETVRQVSL